LTNALLRQRVFEASQSLSAKWRSLRRESRRLGRGAINAVTQPIVDRWRRIEVEDEISVVLLTYFVILFGLLLLVHFLQPERGPITGSSRSPIHVLQRPAK
jgi:hypothetical protein